MARHFNNLTGKTFGNWTVLSQTKTPNARSKMSRWHCRCSCGKESEKVFYTSLVSGRSTSCGMCGTPAHPTNPRMKDRVGEKYGRWTVLSHLPQSKVMAECSCGTIREVPTGRLVSGTSQSCGCLRGEQLGARAAKFHDSEPHLLHDAKNYLYTIWLGMKTRCYNTKHPTYQHYGAKGITIDPAWEKDFRAFAIHVGPRPSKDYSIDRIENNLGYCPGNVRWASRFTQAENRGNNPEVSYRGQTLRLRIVAEQLNLPKSLLFHLFNNLPTLEESIKVSREMMDGDITNAPSHIDGYTTFIDFTGQQRGEWKVLAYTGKEHRTAPSLWLCQNDEGETRILPSILLKRIPEGRSRGRPRFVPLAPKKRADWTPPPRKRKQPPPPPPDEDWV